MTLQFASLIASILCALLPGIYGVTISTTPGSGQFTIGSQVHISCLYTSQFVFDSFVHPIYGQMQGSNNYYRIQNVNNVATLEFLEPRPLDTGTYFCTFDAVSGDGRDHALTNLVYVPSVTFVDQITSFEGLVGESVTLACTPQHASSNGIQWMRNGRVINSQVARVTVVGGDLTIYPAQLGDSGLYVCSAGNAVSLNYVNTYLDISLRPTAVATPNFLEVDLGDSAEFKCVVVAFPAPTVEWVELSTGAVVDSQYTLSVPNNDENNHTSEHYLRFLNVSSEFIGSYRCHAENSGGAADDNRVILNLIGTLGAIQDVVLDIVNQTNIRVTWSAPLANLISYTVTWQSYDGAMPQSQVLNGPNPPTTYLITDLQRLTMYSIFVYATNAKGRGVDSDEMNISSTAVAPSGQVKFTLFDISSVSTRVEFNLSVVDDGGAKLSVIKLFYSQDAGQTWRSTGLNCTRPGQLPNYCTRPALLPNLLPETRYLLRAQPGNEIGFGPLSDTISFTTSPEGYPGSPSHVTIQGLGDNSVLVCWDLSLVGGPFSEHTISWMTANGTTDSLSLDEAELETEQCALGATVGDLDSGSCYQFTVTVSNSRGTGQSSGPSELACTSVPTPIITTATVSPAEPLTTPIIVGAVVFGVLLALIVIVVVILLCCCCLRLRQKQKYNLPDRRESARSDANLMPYQQQISSGSSSSDTSPQTASTQVSNPFLFEAPPNVPSADVPYYYNGTNALGPMGSKTMGPTYPSTGHLMQARSTHSLPAYYPPPTQQPPPPPQHQQSNFEMIDNPYYKKFQLRNIPEQEEEYTNAAYVTIPNTCRAPPLVPPYYADDASEVAQSEVSSIPMGDSYSQPSTSPRLKKKKHKHNHGAQPSAAGVDFIDNNAYETIPHARGLATNGPSVYGDPELESEPRFKIQSQQERGAVFETVQFKYP